MAESPFFYTATAFSAGFCCAVSLTALEDGRYWHALFLGGLALSCALVHLRGYFFSKQAEQLNTQQQHLKARWHLGELTTQEYVHELKELFKQCYFSKR